MKILISLLLVLSLTIISCKNSETEKITYKSEFKSPLDSIKYHNYLKIINISGTFHPFVVVNIKNLNTGEIKEVCTNNNFLIGALNIEFKNKEIDQILKNKDLYFELKDTIALNNIGFNSYSNKELIKFQKEKNIDVIISKVLKKEYHDVNINLKDDRETLFLAHSLFNKGILSGEYSCFSAFQIIDDKWLENRSKTIIERKRSHH